MKHAQVQRLIGAVGARVGVFDPGDQELRVGESRNEVGDEGDGSSYAEVDRLDGIAGT